MKAKIALLALLLALTAYRQWAPSALGIDGYLFYLPGWAFLPLFVWLAILCRNRTKHDIAILLSAVFLMFGCLWSFRWHAQDRDTGTFCLVTINIQSYRSDLRDLADRVQQNNPDFICLQEVWKYPHLDDIRVHLPNYRFFTHPKEKVVDEFLDFGTVVGLRKDWSGTVELGPESTAWVWARKADVQIGVVSLHGRKIGDKYGPEALSQTIQLQRVQMESLKQTALSSGLPLVIGGDFNALPSGPAFKVFPLRSAFFNSGRGFGHTFPSQFPCLQLDQVLGTREVTFTSLETFDAGSDHLALRAHFRLVERED